MFQQENDFASHSPGSECAVEVTLLIFLAGD